MTHSLFKLKRSKKYETVANPYLYKLCFNSSEFLASTNAWNADYYYEDNAPHYYDDTSVSSPAVAASAANYRHHSFRHRSSCNCIKAIECTAITIKIRTASKPLTADFMKDIRKKACGYMDNEPYICCPPLSPAPSSPQTDIDIFPRNSRDITSEKPWIWDIVNDKNDSKFNHAPKQSTNLFNRIGAASITINAWNYLNFPRQNDFNANAPKPYANKDGYARKIHFFDFEDPHTFRNCPPSQSPDFLIPPHFQHIKPFRKILHTTNNANAAPLSPIMPAIHPHSHSHANGFDSERNSVDTEPSIIFPSRSNAAIDSPKTPIRAISKFPLAKLNLINHENCGISIGARIIGGTNAIPGQFPW